MKLDTNKGSKLSFSNTSIEKDKIDLEKTSNNGISKFMEIPFLSVTGKKEF